MTAQLEAAAHVLEMRRDDLYASGRFRAGDDMAQLDVFVDHGALWDSKALAAAEHIARNGHRVNVGVVVRIPGTDVRLAWLGGSVLLRDTIAAGGPVRTEVQS